MIHSKPMRVNFKYSHHKTCTMINHPFAIKISYYLTKVKILTQMECTLVLFTLGMQ
jgi:hypothetical protein